MSGYLSNKYAPYSTCPKCGWSGRDWGFKYRNFCKRCHAQWRKEKAEECKRMGFNKKNLELSNGIVITSIIKERLLKKAQLDVPYSRRMFFSNLCEYIFLLATLIFAIIFLFSENFSPFFLAFSIISYLVVNIYNRIYLEEEKKRMPQVNARLEELAHERQRKIDETNTFYTSSEWRFVRDQVIQEQDHICQECGCRIFNDFNLTVDHIKPRSKFPELALDKSNLQILCRSCNSSKGANYNELN